MDLDGGSGGRPVGSPGPRLFHGQAGGAAGVWKSLGPGAAGIGHEGRAGGRERGGDHPRERRGMVRLVEHVGGDDTVESPQVRSGLPPVEHPRGETFDLQPRGVEPHALEGRLLVVGGGDGEARPGGDERGSPRPQPSSSSDKPRPSSRASSSAKTIADSHTSAQ